MEINKFMDSLYSTGIRLNATPDIVPILLIAFFKQEKLKKLKETVNATQELKETLDEIAHEKPILNKAIEIIKEEYKLEDTIVQKLSAALDLEILEKKECVEILEYIIKEYSKEDWRKTETEMPDCVSKLLIEILDIKNEGEFFEGTFGFGNTAIKAYEKAKNEGKNIKIFGQEKKNQNYAIACQRLVMHGIEDFNLKLADSLFDTSFIDEKNDLKKFNYIVSDLYGCTDFSSNLERNKNLKQLEKDAYGRYIYGIAPTSPEIMHISRDLRILENEGVSCALLTPGTLYRMSGEGKIRKKIMEADYIEAVIQFTGGLYSFSEISFYLMILNKNKEKRMTNKILFINAENIFENKDRKTKILTEENINFIADIYKNKKEVEEISTIVDLDKIEEVDLRPDQYVEQKHYNSSEFGNIKLSLDKLKFDKTIGDICKSYRGINLLKNYEENPEGEYKIINMSNIQDGKLDIEKLTSINITNNPRIEAYIVKAGDLIITNKGATKMCVIPEHKGKILISQSFIGLRTISKEYNPEYLQYYLSSPVGEFYLNKKKIGAGMPVLKTQNLEKIPVPEISLEDQNKALKMYEITKEEKELKIKKLQEELKEAKIELYKNMNLDNLFEITE